MIKKIILVSLISVAALASSQSWTPSDPEIAKLETRVKLNRLPYWNESLPPLNGYTRYYTGATLNGGKVIGELVVPIGSKQQPGIHIAATRREFPIIDDGGCAIVNLVYSVEKDKILQIGCNGRA
jgi:hypothetical protein